MYYRLDPNMTTTKVKIIGYGLVWNTGKKVAKIVLSIFGNKILKEDSIGKKFKLLSLFHTQSH